MANYYVELVEVYDKVDTADNSDTSYNSSEDKPKEKRKLTDLKKEIQSYAISQKAYKKRTKKDN